MAETLLRFLTCGSVDDGKSTLIGRLLHDCGAVAADELEGLTDFSLLADGLEAEREQGITIDVAYLYFATRGAPLHPRRHAGARAIYAQHGDRRLATPTSLSCWSTRARACSTQTRRHAGSRRLLGIRQLRAGGEQDGPGRLRPRRAFEAIARRISPPSPRRSDRGGHRHPGLGAGGRQCRRRRRARMPWYDGPASARLPGEAASRRRSATPCPSACRSRA